MNLNAYYKLQDHTIGTAKIELTSLPGDTDTIVTAVNVNVEIPAAVFPFVDFNYLDMNNAVSIYFSDMDEIVGYNANHRMCEFWCEPAFGTDLRDVPSDTQCLIYQKKDGSFGVILPVCDAEYSCTLSGTIDGLTANIYSLCFGMNHCQTTAFVYAEGPDPFELLEQCTARALKHLGNIAVPRTEREYPEIFDYLGWCTWDAMHIHVNTEGILEKCKEFKEKSVPIKWMILDDMWADITGMNQMQYDGYDNMCDQMHASKMWSYMADPERFPTGLKDCIQQVKEYGLSVGVWHPVTGYWEGIDPNGPAAEEFGDALVETGAKRLVPHWEKERAYRYFDIFHRYLKECGTDFVKIDNQGYMRAHYKGLVPIGKAARNIHIAMEQSVNEKFEGILINCMGMGAENMWNRPTSTLSRCSDDFHPESPSWFKKHIMACSYNSLVQGQFLWCDWDMWWTDDSQGVKNSILRAISGGPIYVSDEIGRTKPELLKPLAFSDGRILRCDRPGMPTADCICANPLTSKKIFKIWNRVGEHGVLAVFNLTDEPVSGIVSPTDFQGTDEYAVYEHFSKEMFPCEKKGFSITLADRNDFRLYIFAPIKDGVAVIGDGTKFISPAAIRKQDGENIELYENGDLIVYKA